MADTFKVGDLVIIVWSTWPKLVGVSGEVISPLRRLEGIDAYGEVGSDLTHEVRLSSEVLGDPSHFCLPSQLLKITPPPDVVDEDERDELTA